MRKGHTQGLIATHFQEERFGQALT